MDSPINSFSLASWQDGGEDDGGHGRHSSNAVASTSRYPYEASGGWRDGGAGGSDGYGSAFGRRVGGGAGRDVDGGEGSAGLSGGHASSGVAGGTSQFRIGLAAHGPQPHSPAPTTSSSQVLPSLATHYALPPIHSFLPRLRTGTSSVTSPASFDHHSQHGPMQSPPRSPQRGSTNSPDESRPVHRTTNPTALLSSSLWEDEATVCFQVLVQGHTVARRADNNEINCTKLLNVTGMTRGRRDGLLKSEKLRNIVKRGSLQLKGVWLSFPRALIMARANNLEDELYPLFEEDIESFLYQPANRIRTTALLLASAEFRAATPATPVEGSSPDEDKATRLVAVHAFLDGVEQRLIDTAGDEEHDESTHGYGPEPPAVTVNRLAPRSSGRSRGVKPVPPAMGRRRSSSSDSVGSPRSPEASASSSADTVNSFTFGTGGMSRGSNWVDIAGEHTEEEERELRDAPQPMSNYGAVPLRHPGFHLTDPRRHSYPNAFPTLQQMQQHQQQQHQQQHQQYVHAMHPTLGARALSIDSAALARIHSQAAHGMGKTYDPPEGPPPGYFQQYESTSTSFPFPSSSYLPHAPIASPSLDYQSGAHGSGHFEYHSSSAHRGSYMPTQTPLPPMYQPLTSPNPVAYGSYTSVAIPTPHPQQQQHYPFAQLRQTQPNAFQPISSQHYFNAPPSTLSPTATPFFGSYTTYSPTTSPHPTPAGVRRLRTPSDRRDSLIGVLGPLELQPVLTKRGGVEDEGSFGDEGERKRIRIEEDGLRRASSVY